MTTSQTATSAQTGHDSSSQLEQAILQDIESRRDELIQLCARLVEAPSVNPPGKTREVADVVIAYLQGKGLSTDRIAIEDDVPNVVSSIGSPAGPHVVMNAHMDTMLPGVVADWTVPVMSLTKRDGHLYGLGMGNMKGGLAAMCVALSALARHSQALAGKISLTTVSDEVMFGNRGTEYLLKQRPDLFGDYLICAEGPGDMHFAIAEKGLLWVDIEASGEAGHSSRALRNQTAAARLARFLAEVDALNEVYADLPPELDGINPGEGRLGLRVSANAGTLEAGPVRSLVSPTARAGVDIRVPPGLTILQLQQRLEQMASQHTGIRVSFPKAWSPSWAGRNAPIVRCMDAAIQEIRQKAPEHVVRLPGSDARHWRDKGVSAVCFGPQPTLSSGVDDYANEQDVIDCAKIYALSALRLLQLKKNTQN